MKLTITVTQEDHDGELLYVGRVAEFPNISAFEDSFEKALSLVVDAVITLKAMAND